MNTPIEPSLSPCTLVTGASSGIGHELALQLAQAGTRVLALGRDAQRLQALARRHALIEPVQADLADLDGIPSLVQGLLSRHAAIDCVLHNAAIQHEVDLDAPGYGPAQVRQELDTNLGAPLLLTHALLPHLKSQRRARIVTVSSVLAHAPKRGAAVYSASKAGLHLFTQALRVQLQGSAVQVLEVVMPLVDTPMTQGRGRGKLAPAEAARRLLAGLAQEGRDELWIGQAAAARQLLRWAPWLMRRILLRGG